MKLKGGLSVCKLPKIIVISGPTASGKTALAIRVARAVNGVIISADSMQVYKGLDIGTAKVLYREMFGIEHQLLDIVYPYEKYSVADFQKAARRAIANAIKQGKVPILVGGTGLYIQSVVFDYLFDEIEPLDYERYEKYSLQELVQRLSAIDQQTYATIDLQNRRRLVHALALAEQTKQSKSKREQQQAHRMLYNIYSLAIMPEREQLYARINQRVEQMMQEGLVAEVAFFNQKMNLAPQVQKAIGYKETLAFLKGDIVSKTELLAEIQKNTRRFAKRQVTWIKNQRITYNYLTTEQNEPYYIKEIVKFLKENG